MTMKKLPVPRLQIVWEDTAAEEIGPYSFSLCNQTAIYELVMYEGKECLSDCRANDEDDQPTEGVVKVEMGKTKVSSGKPPALSGDKLSTPFRDGVHIMRDSIRLGDLPMYVIYEDQTQEIEQQLVECDGQIINKCLLEKA